MLSQCIESCQNLHGLCALVSDLKPVGGLGTREVRVMSADASDNIPISLIVKKCLELTESQSTFTPAEQADHQKILDKIKVLDAPAFRELQKNQLAQQLQAYLSDSTIMGNKALVVQRIQEAFHYQSTRLDLSNLQITEVPSCLNMLPWLQELVLSNNLLETLPPEIRALTKLQELGLSHNQLRILSPEIGALTQLQRLGLSHNLLTTLPPEIRALTKLQTLVLSNNLLEILPPGVEELTQLQGLGLSNNLLRILPPEVGALTQLQGLDLSNNLLATLLPGIKELTQLQVLNVSNNQLTTFPSEVGALPQLEVLDLSHNQLTTLPSEIGALTQLQTLDLSHNQLATLPPEVGALPQLQVLVLSNNSDLRELPLTLGSLPGLIYIDPEGTALDSQLVDALLAQCAAIRGAQGQLLLPNRLQMWLAAGKVDLDLSPVEKLTEPECRIINEWLVRLEKTNDFRGKQQPLAQTVCEMLYDMTQHATLKELFLAFMAANNEACEDRSVQVLNELYTAWKLWQLPENAPLSEQLNIMILAANTLALRDAITACIQEEEKKNGRPELEAIEIQLYFGGKVGEKLPLLNAIQEMHYAGLGNRNWIQLDDLIKTVKDTYIDHLIKFPLFDKLLQGDKTFQEMWAPQASECADQLDALENLAQTMNEQKYLKATETLAHAREQKYKETVERWLILNGVKNISRSSALS